MNIELVLKAFGLRLSDFQCDRITTGHINFTYKLSGSHHFILQRVNKNIFKQPEIIANNIRLASDHLKKHYPDYLFLGSIPSLKGEEMVYDDEGFPWRLFPFISNVVTINDVQTETEAYNAAMEFGKLAGHLWNCEMTPFKESIPQFHNLQLRFHQFETALVKGSEERKRQAEKAINQAMAQSYLVTEYLDLIRSGTLQLHIMHNDTKINNILFDQSSRKAVCVIDLDTLMPGYFIYDLGDMIRTFVSPVSEEEKDAEKIIFRENIYRSLIDGYFASMSQCLSDKEKSLAPFSGYMMTYIMALRFLTDYLNGDIYYQTHYQEQNLVRAQNQLHLLSTLQAALN
jgi:Ser/Thr protein kinase RdoA (MazF antagonist)